MSFPPFATDEPYETEETSTNQVVSTVKDILETIVNQDDTGTETVPQQTFTIETTIEDAFTTTSTMKNLIDSFPLNDNWINSDQQKSTITEAVTTVQNIVTTLQDQSDNSNETFPPKSTTIGLTSFITEEIYTTESVITTENGLATIIGSTGKNMIDTATLENSASEDTSTIPSLVSEAVNTILNVTETPLNQAIVNTTDISSNGTIHKGCDSNTDRDDVIVIILGVLLAIFILISMVLFLMYIRHKRKCRLSYAINCYPIGLRNQ